MRKLLLLSFLTAFVAIISSSCGGYSKLAKSGSIADKDSAAVYFYNKGKYDHAVYLFEELMGVYRGKPRARDVYYYYAYCRYHMGELVSAAYYFEDFTRQYPRDPEVEEMKYMKAYCYFMISDPWYLDQTYTDKAVEHMQLFIETYPYSDKREKANEIIFELREKLAHKAYEQSKLYFKLTSYKAAKISFETLINEFPDSEYREESQYMLFKSTAMLGNVSVRSKRLDRYEEAMNYYRKFLDRYPESEFKKDGEDVFEMVQKKYSELNAEIEEEKAKNL